LIKQFFAHFMTISTYLKNSSHRFYGAVVALVMLILYEICIVWGGPEVIIRNAPEAWLRLTLNFFGVSHYYISFIMVTVFILAIPIFYKAGLVVERAVFPLMIGESIIWGIFSGIFIQMLIANLFFMSGGMTNSIVRNLGLAIGAGLFEELFFRVILTTSLIWILLKIIKIKWISVSLAVLVASLLFSAAHYVGNAADVFELYSFLFRFFAGLWFTTLYAARGFAVVCMTHAFYDILVILV
jgi:membrane protease YdiL (CAAX protease family)